VIKELINLIFGCGQRPRNGGVKMSKQFRVWFVLSMMSLLLIAGCGGSGGGGSSLTPQTTTDTVTTTGTGTNTGGGNTEVEPNDSFTAAQAISAGIDYLGQNNGSDSNDYFKVTASGSSMTVSLSHLTANASGSDFDVYIYNASQTQIAYFSAYNGVDKSAVVTGLTTSLTYYVKVYVGYSGVISTNSELISRNK